VNYFPFHIGDYSAHTGHLEPMEDLAYMRLLQQYYLREGPLPADIQATAKLVRMRSMADDVESVLREFFVLTDDGWTHARCDAEIAKMKDKQEKARASGLASANARKAYAERKSNPSSTSVDEKPTNVERTLTKDSTNVQLPTPTPTPTPTPVKKNTSASALACPPDVDESVWSDFLQLRKTKRAPLTQTALDGIAKQAGSAGITLSDALAVCCKRGWVGFEADWLTKSNSRAGPEKQSRHAGFESKNYREGIKEDGALA
jgi:uncharacterized protein YdaU (DUF1376 family)